MAAVATYLNFQGNAEEAFAHYASVFGTEIAGPVVRFGDVGFGSGPDAPSMSDADMNKIVHARLPIMMGHVLMATDMLESLGHQVRVGNNTSIHLIVDAREEADRLFALLGAGSTECSPMADMSWGQYWGTALDRFGIRWMISVEA